MDTAKAGRMGGLVRAKRLSAKRRKEIARAAGIAIARAKKHKSTAAKAVRSIS